MPTANLTGGASSPSLGAGYRHITYDMRARGKSKRSADYSFETALRDLDAVLKARGVERPLLVGWSYGGILAWHWADRNPDRILGVVTVDAFPSGLTGEAGRARIRKLFGQMRWMMPLARALRLTAQMTTDEHIVVNIDANEIGDASKPLLERLACPVRFVLATGDSLGTQGRGDGRGPDRARSDPRPQPEPQAERQGREQPHRHPA